MPIEIKTQFLCFFNYLCFKSRESEKSSKEEKMFLEGSRNLRIFQLENDSRQTDFQLAAGHEFYGGFKFLNFLKAVTLLNRSCKSLNVRPDFCDDTFSIQLIFFSEDYLSLRGDFWKKNVAFFVKNTSFSLSSM